MRSLLPKFARVLLLLILAASLAAPVSAGSLPQAVSPQAKAHALLSQMTPEEKVGQLFMITFTGTDASDRSTIYDLITSRHIGGVVLSRKNNNFSDADNVVDQAYKLTTALQNDEYAASQDSSKGSPPTYVPLLVGISQEGNLYPYDQILSGTTALPDLMAIGATWNPTLAQNVGAVMGKELQAMGFNLYLGPSLDVLDQLSSDTSDDLGVRTFGGDPYWVSQLGKAYIAGLHQGSSNQLAVIATHFPGRGSSDRSPETEIATVRKSLDQLNHVELAPFFGVTGGSDLPDSTTDGLLVSHIRYQGFQGNIRDITTKPISFDQAALNEILKLAPFVPWRDAGGLLVSDDLGSPALRKFFDPSGNSFDAGQVARNALLAGNDLLYADNMISSGDPDSATTIKKTLDFFTTKYKADTVLAQRVDAAVERILTLKYKLYPTFSPDQVIPAESALNAVGSNPQATISVASSAATLISPDPNELANVLPKPPAPGERIVFITDDPVGRQCSNCSDHAAISYDALQSTVVRLYGSQISRNLLTSYSYTDLYQLLMQQTTKKPIEDDLRQANWVVIAALKPSADRPESTALKRLLSDRPDLIRNKRVIVFAFDAPYSLDATEISKLTAYYGLYGKSQPFVEVATRILFQEHIPSGALPISVPGVGYDLLTATSPDPNQVILLSLDEETTASLATPPVKTTLTPEPTTIPRFKLGDTLRLRTGVIVDHNNHPVPDGTVVRFLITAGTPQGIAQTIEAQTQNGIARVSYKIDRGELLEISARSEPATNSTRLLLDITGGGNAAITLIAPTSLPTLTPTVTVTVTPTITPTVTPTQVPIPPQIVLTDWMLAVLVTLGSAAALVWLGMNLVVARWALRWGLCTLIGGLLVYNYLALRLPGSQNLLKAWGTPGVVAATLAGALAGGLAGWAWQRIAMRQQAGGRSPSGTTSPKS